MVQISHRLVNSLSCYCTECLYGGHTAFDTLSKNMYQEAHPQVRTPLYLQYLVILIIVRFYQFLSK